MAWHSYKNLLKHFAGRFSVGYCVGVHRTEMSCKALTMDRLRELLRRPSKKDKSGE